METLLEQQAADEAAAAEAARRAEEGGEENLPEATSSRARLMAQEANKATFDPALAAAGAEEQAAQAATPLDSFTTVLGSPSGSTLRRIVSGPAARGELMS